MKSTILFTGLLIAACLLFTGCVYDFPLTAKPTQKIDCRLLGDWIGVDQENAKKDCLRVQQFDESTYAVGMDEDIYRVFHSDFAGIPLLSIQDLTPGNRKYLYFAWRLSADGTQLYLKGVNAKIIPETTKTAREIQRLVKQHIADPDLFREELHFTRKNSGT